MSLFNRVTAQLADLQQSDKAHRGSCFSWLCLELERTTYRDIELDETDELWYRTGLTGFVACTHMPLEMSLSTSHNIQWYSSGSSCLGFWRVSAM